MWTYRCKLKKVIDGDTVDVDIDLGFGIWQMNERVRIMGIDTPESSCLLYTSPSPRDRQKSRMPSSA